MGKFLAYHRVDDKAGQNNMGRYREPCLFALDQLDATTYRTSAAICDMRSLLDFDARFEHTISSVCHDARSVANENKVPLVTFAAAYAAGMRFRHDWIANDENENNRLLIEAKISFNDNSERLPGRIEALSTKHKKIRKKNDMYVEAHHGPLEKIMADEDAVYCDMEAGFVKHIRNNPALSVAVFDKRTDRILYASAHHYIANKAATQMGKDLAKRTDDRVVPLITAVTPHRWPHETRYMSSLESNKYEVTGRKVIPVTNPLDDPAAAFNIMQLVKFRSGEEVTNERKTQSIAAFLNEQANTFVFPATPKRFRSLGVPVSASAQPGF